MTFIVYGQGISTSALVRAGKETFLASLLRSGLAKQHERLMRDDAWCVEVQCDESNLDQQTRHDTATIGYFELGTDGVYSDSETHHRWTSMSFDELLAAVRRH